ncbi:hypothetical protein LINGRAHAP2_LOCUS7125 [Linum grandiflorum]
MVGYPLVLFTKSAAFDSKSHVGLTGHHRLSASGSCPHNFIRPH